MQLGDEAFEVALYTTPKKQAQTLIAVGLDSSDAYHFIRKSRSESGVDLVIGFQASKERRICARRVTEMFERVLYFEVVQPADFNIFLSYLDETVRGAPNSWRADASHLHLVGNLEIDAIMQWMARELDTKMLLVGESLDLTAIREMQHLYRDLFTL